MAIELQQHTSDKGSKNKSATLDLNLSFLKSNKISSKDRVFFFQQLQLLLQTGTPIYAGLAALQKLMKGNLFPMRYQHFQMFSQLHKSILYQQVKRVASCKMY